MMKRLLLPVIGSVGPSAHETALLTETGKPDRRVTVLPPCPEGEFHYCLQEERAVWDRIAKQADACREDVNNLDGIDVLLDTPGGSLVFDDTLAWLTGRAPSDEAIITSFAGGSAYSLGATIALFESHRLVATPYTNFLVHSCTDDGRFTRSREELEQVKIRADTRVIRLLCYALLDAETGQVREQFRDRILRTFYPDDAALQRDEAWVLAAGQGQTKDAIGCDPLHYKKGEISFSSAELHGVLPHLEIAPTLDQFEQAYADHTGRRVDRQKPDDPVGSFFAIQDLQFRLHGSGQKPLRFETPSRIIANEKQSKTTRRIYEQWARDYHFRTIRSQGTQAAAKLRAGSQTPLTAPLREFLDVGGEMQCDPLDGFLERRQCARQNNRRRR